ncbi:hypothetical protein [Alkalihalobacterium elongatum]|uniref:hypothetical protein n=1 Tax=Alkalihalobacterium elongatum TaxID=2675466 RepID=UPI001C1F48B8|nr:hypothetical protein [Alkalihalobacterium elongatum]
MSFVGRFTNIQIQMDKKLVQSFLERIEQAYRYEWVTNDGYNRLIIHGDKKYNLPFKEEDGVLRLTIDELTTNERTFSIAFNELLFEARKKMMGIENVFERKERRFEKRQQDIKLIQTQRKVEEQKKLAPPITNETKEHMIKLEINYLLMELHEAINEKDKEKELSCKSRLQELVEQSQRIS